MVNKAVRSGDVDAVWNTGRGYSEHNQRMSARLLPDGRVAFFDIDRHLDGILHQPFQTEGAGNAGVDPGKLASFVMTEYDHGRYNSGFYDLQRNGQSFESIDNLTSSMKDAAKSIDSDGHVVVLDKIDTPAIVDTNPDIYLTVSADGLSPEFEVEIKNDYGVVVANRTDEPASVVFKGKRDSLISMYNKHWALDVEEDSLEVDSSWLTEALPKHYQRETSRMSAAINTLQSYPKDALISEFYDQDSEFAVALNELFRGTFEYPDFSYRKISEVVKVGKRELAALAAMPADLNDKYADTIIGNRVSEYDALEVHGVRDLNDVNSPKGTACEVNDLNPQFYSVYAHAIEGGVESVGDFGTHRMAVDYAGELSHKHQWPINDYAQFGVLSKSRAAAEEIARTKGDFDFADVQTDQTVIGSVMGVTDLHIVVSRGRSATILAHTDLSRIPSKDEITTIVFKDGKGTVANLRDTALENER